MSIKTLQKGFTLVELLVSISIVAILIAISIFGIQGAKQTARDTKRKADLEQIRSGLEFYRADCNIYPVAPFPRTYTNNWPNPLVGSGLPVGSACLAANTYLNQPADPVPATQYYRYSSVNGTTYDLWAYLEGGSTPASNCPAPPVCGTGLTCNYCVRP